MAINIVPQGIQIGAYLLKEGEGGLIFNGNVTYLGEIDNNYFVGTAVGFTTGGYNTPPTVLYNTIERFPFASNSNAIDTGDITSARFAASGQCSDAHGYTSGGITTAPATTTNIIDRFPFATYTNASDVGDLTAARQGTSGQSSSDSGYVTSGVPGNPSSIPTPVPLNPAFRNKFPFANNSNATYYYGLDYSYYNTGHSSPNSGYASGGRDGYPTPPGGALFSSNSIFKFPFAVDLFSGSIGDLTAARVGASGQSSFTHGYVSGGGTAPDDTTTINTIDKFPFASSSNATDVGDLTAASKYSAGQSSTQSGYSSGGLSPTAVNKIEKFPFASETTSASDVGDLTIARYYVTGMQD